jgi:hypothetical protein
MASGQLGEFFPLLQQGFAVTAHVGCTLDKLLGRQWNLTDDYVARRVTTIFLDGRAIDDVNTAVIREGSVIALSGAMPGLVGATMRRGGYYAAMRDTITYRETAVTAVPARIATVRVKLFNLLLPELGPNFLRRGIIVNSSELTDFLGSKDGSFWQGCSSALLNGSPARPALLQSGEPFSPGEAVRLTINFWG